MREHTSPCSTHPLWKHDGSTRFSHPPLRVPVLSRPSILVGDSCCYLFAKNNLNIVYFIPYRKRRCTCPSYPTPPPHSSDLSLQSPRHSSPPSGASSAKSSVPAGRTPPPRRIPGRAGGGGGWAAHRHRAAFPEHSPSALPLHATTAG